MMEPPSRRPRYLLTALASTALVVVVALLTLPPGAPSSSSSLASLLLAATASPPPSLSAALWADPAVVRLTTACETDGFVVALADGSLPRDNFAGYVAQDKFYLGAFAQAYALARDKAAAEGDLRSAAELQSEIVGVEEELSLHDGYAAEWGVDLTLDIRPVPACSEYVAFLLRVCSDERGDVATCAAAMVPCMRLYAALGQRLAARQRRCVVAAAGATGSETTAASSLGPCGAGAYQEWIDTYAAADFEAEATLLEKLLDRAAARSSAPREQLRENYVRAMQLEYRFFDAWSPSGGGGGPAAESASTAQVSPIT